MARRSSKPLFELMGEQGREDSDRSWDSSGPERPRRSPAKIERAQDRRSQPAAHSTDSRRRATVTIPLSVVYVLVPAMLLLGLLAWSAGHHFGRRSAERDLLQDIGGPPPVNLGISEPLDDPAPGPAEPATDQQSAPVATGAVLTATGPSAVDPRTPGLNYLNLGSLPQAQAVDAIRFLADNGVEVIGLVDHSSGDANNEALYTLFSLGLAVPGADYYEMGAERERHKKLVESIGKRWQREQRGGSDFSDTFWAKFIP